MGYVVSLTVESQRAVVVGGGAVALRKVTSLLAAGARVSIVAPTLCRELERLETEGRVECSRREYREGDLAGARLVIAATGDDAVNAGVAREALSLGIPVNVVDRPELCTFTLPAVVRRGDLTIAVATGGRCPALARAIREELEQRYGEEYAVLVEYMGRLRDVMKERGWASETILANLSALHSRGLLRLLNGPDPEQVASLVRDELGDDFPVPPIPDAGGARPGAGQS